MALSTIPGCSRWNYTNDTHKENAIVYIIETGSVLAGSVISILRQSKFKNATIEARGVRILIIFSGSVINLIYDHMLL
jgi:hypothetical protein